MKHRSFFCGYKGYLQSIVMWLIWLISQIIQDTNEQMCWFLCVKTNSNFLRGRVFSSATLTQPHQAEPSDVEKERFDRLEKLILKSMKSCGIPAVWPTSNLAVQRNLDFVGRLNVKIQWIYWWGGETSWHTKNGCPKSRRNGPMLVTYGQRDVFHPQKTRFFNDLHIGFAILDHFHVHVATKDLPTLLVPKSHRFCQGTRSMGDRPEASWGAAVPWQRHDLKSGLKVERFSCRNSRLNRQQLHPTMVFFNKLGFSRAVSYYGIWFFNKYCSMQRALWNMLQAWPVKIPLAAVVVKAVRICSGQRFLALSQPA